MEKTIGKITDKSTKSGEKNGKQWTSCVFKIGDFMASTFDTELMNNFEIGNNVKAFYEVNGKYNNIVSMEHTEESSQGGNMDKDRRIVRQNCNQRAIELATLMKDLNPDALKELIKANDAGLQGVIDIMSTHFEERVFR